MIEEYQFLKPRVEHLKQLILDTEKELVFAEVNEQIYLEESVNPKHIGKDKAMQNLGTYQQHIVYLKQKLEILKGYAKAKDLQI